MDRGNQPETNKEILLSMLALLDKRQRDVAALNRKMDQVCKEISNLHKEHKQNAQKLNSLIAAHEMKGTRTPNVKRSGCMPLKTIDLTLDEDEKDKAAPAAAGSRKA